MQNLFAYFETGKVSDDLTQQLEEEINQLRNDEKWWGEYMKNVIKRIKIFLLDLHATS